MPEAINVFSVPNGSTSPMRFAPPKNMTSLSTPQPHPPVGGMPISSTRT